MTQATEFVEKDWEKEGYDDYFKGREYVHQIGYTGPDWRGFCQKHHDLFGSGPFYYTTNKFRKVIYRGKEVEPMVFEACYGAWGDGMIEIVTQATPDVPTFFTEFNDITKAGMNHTHIIVPDLTEAKKACEYLGIDIVTEGYADRANAAEKSKSMGISEVKREDDKMSFMVVDMVDDFGMMVQLVEPSAKRIHNLLRESAKDWDGETDLFRKIGG